jgi:predicted RNase H-like HicB family nuclease
MKHSSEMAAAKATDAKSYLRQPYARILIPEEEGGFSAEILEFPGCFADGETPVEAFRNLESVAESWIEASLEQGQEIPPPSANHSYAGRIALRLPRDLHRQAARKADRDGVSLNQVLVTAVAAWVGADNLFERIAHRIEMNLNSCRKSAKRPTKKV